MVGGCVLALLLPAVRFGVSPGTAHARTTGPAAALDSTEEFGVNTGVMFNAGRYTRAQIDAQLAALANTGATVVRSDALWEDAEPQAPIGIFHRYNWTLDDLIVSSLDAHGLRWLPIIDYSTPWGRAVPGQIHSPPASVSDFAGYAAAVASRYGPGGSFWLENPGLRQLPVLTYEIWNEPDNTAFWAPSPDPGAYANLYGAARGAILSKQAGAQVIVGGLTRPAWFIAGMLAADPRLRGEIDGVAIHPYASTPDKVFAAVRAARLAMDSDGLGEVPLYITELGWATHGSGGRDTATEAERPAYIVTTISTLAHSDCGIAGVMLYAWTTAQRNPSNPQDWFGISPPNASPSADTAAFTTALQAAEAPAPAALLCTTNPALVDARVLPPATPRRAARTPAPGHGRTGHVACRRGVRRHSKCRPAPRRRR
jgi:polysaccharide biosynthesis protein PslG